MFAYLHNVDCISSRWNNAQLLHLKISLINDAWEVGNWIVNYHDYCSPISWNWGNISKCLLLLLKTDLCILGNILFCIFVLEWSKSFAMPTAHFETILETCFLNFLVCFFKEENGTTQQQLQQTFTICTLKYLSSWFVFNFWIPKRTFLNSQTDVLIAPWTTFRWTTNYRSPSGQRDVPTLRLLLFTSALVLTKYA